MKAGFPLLKARIALILSAVLVLTGAVPFLSLGALVGWQIVMRFQAGTWLPFSASGVSAHPAVIWIAGLAGLAIAALGVFAGLRQSAAIRARKQQHEDRLRRVQDYRRDASPADRLDGRREPYISGRRAA